MKKYKKKIINKKSEFLDSVEENGRAVVGVMPEDNDDPRAIQFAYSVPRAHTVEPVVLTSYPSSKTAPWLLNSVGDYFREHGWDFLEEDSVTFLDGFLGADGEIPVAVRVLSAAEHAVSKDKYTCMADERLPVVLLTVPDPSGLFPWDEDCFEVVKYAEAELVSTLNP
jgi:hypothetical protein